MRLLLVPASLCLAACTAPSDSVGVAVAYVGPHDKRPPCLAYSTQELMEQTVTEARRSADCIFPDPLPILVDAPAFYRTLDRLPNHEGVAAPEHFETHILFVVVTRAGPVLKRVRLEQGLQALDELGSHASQADRERVRADFIGPVRRMDVTLSAGDADYQR
jgi:hypothetical protein